MTCRWYVLCSKPNKEQILYRQLQSQGFELFYPRYYEPNDTTGKLQLKPYSPGYMFVRCDLKIIGISKFQWMPNSEGLVSFGLNPPHVPDTLLGSIKRHVDQLCHMNEEKYIDSTSKDGIETNKEDSRLNEYWSIIDLNKSSDERVKGLLRMLQGMSSSKVSRVS